MRGLPTMLQLGPSTVFKGVNFTLFCVLATIASASGPVSLTTLGGTNALFHCNGSGTVLQWEIDGLPNNDQSIVDREITEHTVSSSGTVQSTLTVPATQENDGITLRCFIGPSLFSLTLIGNSSTLTVLPGIGPVVNVRFTPSFSAVLWDPPATAGVLSGLSYIVIVMNNNNTGQVIVSDTTNNTIYPLPPLPFCQYYTANVTAFSSQHFSEGVVIGQRQGEIFILTSSQDIDVTRKDNTSINLSVHLNLEVLDGLPCFGQMLKFQTYPRDDISNITNHSEVMISGRGDHVYPIIVTESKLLCTVAISLIANDAVLDVLTLDFSTFDVQNCNITTSTDQSSIMVECRFAINSTALSGIVVIKDDHDQPIEEKELNIKHGNNMKSVNITDLPTGNYNASVFDNMKDNQPAYSHPEFLKIVVHSPIPTPSNTVVHTDIPFSVSASVYSSKSSNVAATSTPPPPAVKTDSTPVIIGSSVAAAVIVIILVILPGLCIFLLRSYYYCQKASLGPDLNVETVFKIDNENEYSVVNIKPKQPDHVVNVITTGDYAIDLELEPSSEYCFTTPPTIDAYNEKHLVQQSINSPASECTVTYSKKTAKQKEPVYADLHLTTNGPAPPLPVEPVPVQYASVKSQTATKDKVSGEPVYADLHHSANPPVPPLPAEKVQYSTVTEKTCSQPSSTMSSSSHVQSQDNLLLHTSTRTSDYYSAQSSRSTDQTSVESSESNAEAVSSDLKERNVPNTGANGSIYQEAQDCTDNNDNAEIVSKSTTFIIHVVEEEETRSCYGSNLLISNGTDLEFFSEFDAAPTVHNKTSSVWEPSVETIPDTCHTTSKLVFITPEASVLNKTNTQYTTHNTKSASIPSFSANWAASAKGDRSYTPDCDWSNSVRRRNC